MANKLAAKEIENLGEVLRIVRNIEADIHNATNHPELFELSPMSAGDSLENLRKAVDEVVRLVQEVIRKSE